MSSSSTQMASSSSSLCSEFKSLALQNNPQWLNLPDYITEKILERLPITSYVRFASICRQWRTLQQNHRRLHSPAPPPMLHLPFFIPLDDHHKHPLLLNALQKRKNPSLSRPSSSFPCGWLILDDAPHNSSPKFFHFTLLNPVSGEQARLPQPNGLYFRYQAAMSRPRTASWALFMVAKQMCGCDLLFFRQVDTHWTSLSCRDLEYSSFEFVTNIVCYAGMFYCVRYESAFTITTLDPDHLGVCLYVLDAIPNAEPEIRFVEMDLSQLPTVGENMRVSLVESDGQILLVVEILEDIITVFKADLLKKMWVRMDSIGNKVLVLNHQCCVSLVAADLGVRRNSIYSCSKQNSWQVFDVGTGRATDGSAEFPSPSTHLMFLPSIC